MDSRFVKLFAINDRLYLQGSPVLLEAGALLKDSTTGRVLAQLKICNLSEQSIVACKVGIKAYEMNGNEVEGIDEYSYLDISVPMGDFFGVKTPIYMPDPITRRIDVVVLEVVFADHSVWKSEFMKWTPLEKQEELNEIYHNFEIVKQYQMEMTDDSPAMKENAPIYYPVCTRGIFMCTCGTVNKPETRACRKCHRRFESMMSVLNDASVEERCQERLREEKEEQEAAIALEQEVAQKRAILKAKRKKKAIAWSLVVIILGTLITLTPKYIVPPIKQLIDYNRAQKYLTSEKYDDAIDAFDKLGKYKDSPEKKRESIYHKALFLMNEGNYDEAISLFFSIEAYKDAETKRMEAVYCKAEKLLGEGEYETAKYLFYSIPSYNDSLERRKEIIYKQGEIYLHNGEYLFAKTEFERLGDYHDSAERFLEVCYAEAESFYKKEEYSKAFVEWNELGDYLDCKELIENVKADLLEKGEYMVLAEALLSIGDKDGWTEYMYMQGVSEIRSSSSFGLGLNKLIRIRDYKDTNEVIVKNELSSISKATVGSYVYFGTYEQDGDNENGPEMIRWKVVEKKNDTVLLQSRDALMAWPMGHRSITWETSSLRVFLNNGFFETAFSTEEKSQILMTVVKAEKNPYKKKGIGTEKDTKDKIFIWDAAYCEKYSPIISYNKVVRATVDDYYIKYPATRTRTVYDEDSFLAYSPRNSIRECREKGFYGYICSNSESLPVVPLMWVKITRN